LAIVNLIISLLSFFLLIILLVLFRQKLIYFFQIRYLILVYGRYSFERLEYYKKNNLRSPYNTCIKDEIIIHFMVFFKKIRNATDYQSNTKINFCDIPFMSTWKSFKKLKAAPDCMNIARFTDAKVKVVGYNESWEGIRIKTLYYFLNNNFVLGEYHISESLKVNSVRVLQKISSKYLQGIELNGDVIYITDTEKNQLNFENNGFSIGIRYLYRGDEVINQLLSNLFNEGGSEGEAYKKVLQKEGYLNRL